MEHTLPHPAERLAIDDIDVAAEQIGERPSQVLESPKVGKPIRIRRDVDQHVDVTASIRLTSGHGAKDADVRCAMSCHDPQDLVPSRPQGLEG